MTKNDYPCFSGRCWTARETLTTQFLYCPWLTEGPDCSNAQPLEGVQGAELLAIAMGFATSSVLGLHGGLVASVPSGRETSLILAAQSDEAGNLPIIAQEQVGIRALQGQDDEVYYTTTDGKLCRRHRDAPSVEILLTGLSADTALASVNGQVFVADREGKQVLRVVP